MTRIGPVSLSAGDLSRGFDRRLRTGDRATVAAELRAALCGTDGSAAEEREVIIALAGSMIRYVDRRSRLVLLYGGVGRHLQLVSMADYLTDWAFELFKAGVDYGSNATRVEELCRHLGTTSSVMPELSVLRAAAGAMNDVLGGVRADASGLAA